MKMIIKSGIIYSSISIRGCIMLYISNVPVTIEINTVQDLSKLGAFMEHNNLKLNKS